MSVPPDAKVTVNGRETWSTGSLRQYYSSGLERGHEYSYVIRARVVRHGQVEEETRTVALKAGQSIALDFKFNATAEKVATNP